MLCAHCRHVAAVSGGTLCAQCAAIVAPPPPGPTPAGVPGQAYGGAPAPVYTGAPGPWLRSPVGLGRAAAIALGLVIAADLFAVWADFLEIDITGVIADGGHGDDVTRRAAHADRMSAVSGFVQLTTMAISVVLYLCWFYRVRVNAEVFDRSAHSKARGWAIGGWFTPVVGLWFPRRIAADIWDASTPWGARRSHGLINTWWALWLFSLLADQVAFKSSLRAETASELNDASVMALFADVVDSVAAVLAIAVVLGLTRMQHEKALAGPPPA
ncbi:DUF4328 domain-containing protein [Streptomyces sp. RY43-2]|uniref:DUF4328 domain-containing protein n=1 Tax=Streptomyces macrolidinus TaxID=2952607 RepID=A0ABT0ZK23_9ACTN|nr:DUF4328 domain-containing protein [Streptomyces macrolidinus]MCN9243937.1 DUF4328 domain-containing protein [Streptomyces macrolidinus]